MISFRKGVGALLLLALFVQCASNKNSARSGELNRPLKDLRRAVHYALKGKVKNQSENGRTYFSVYHRPGMDTRLSAHKQKERAQVAITILGDRRPYEVLVLYRVETLTGGKFSLSRYDKSLANQYLERVSEYLASRPEDRDIIDDFRPY